MSTDPEFQLLSGLLAGSVEFIDEVSHLIREEHFVDPTHKLLYRQILSYRSIARGVLPSTAVESAVSGLDAGTAALVSETYDALFLLKTPTDVARFAVHSIRASYEKRLTQIALREASDILSGAFTEEPVAGRPARTWSGPSDAREWARARIGEIDAETAMAESPAADVLLEGRGIIEDYLAAASEDKQRRPRLGIPAIDEATDGFGKGLIMVAGPSGLGKAMPLDARVLTPSGFVRMGDIQVGDAVVDPRGMPSQVLGVYPQGQRDVYQVTFSDGTSCEADGDHLWETSYWSKPYLRTEIIRTTDLLKRKSTAIPYMEVAPDLGTDDLPLDPYVVGVLLGDGYLGQSTPQITCADPELIEELGRLLPLGASVVRVNSARPSRASNYLVRGVVPIVRSLGLLQSRSETKAVPRRYLHTSAAARLALLQGLMDTHGSVSGTGFSFDSVSRQLRDDVEWLARSLGFRVSDNGPEGSSHKYFNVQHQEWREAQPRFRSYISPQRPGLPVLFRLQRKAERAVRSFEDKRVRNARTVSSVEFVRRTEVQCIAVSAPSRLYVTDDFIVTHNTQACVALAYHAAVHQGLHVYFATSETVRQTVRSRLAARHSRHERFEGMRSEFNLATGLNSKQIDRGTLPPEHMAFFAQVAADWGVQGPPSSEGTCYVAQMPHGETMASLAAQIRSRSRLVKPDLVIIDYIALMSPESRSYASSREALASVVKEAAHFSVDFDNGRGVPTVSPWQLNRESQKEMTKTGIVDTSGLAETAEAVNSAHLVLVLSPDGARDERSAGLKISVPKNRDGEVLLGDQAVSVRVDYASSFFEQRVGASFSGDGESSLFADDSMSGLVPEGI